MDKYTYFVIDIEETLTGLCYATTRRIHNATNLIGLMDGGSGYIVKSVNACDTKKDAERIAAVWNEDYTKQGRYKWA